MYIQRFKLHNPDQILEDFCQNLEQQLKDTTMKLEYKNLTVGKTFVIIDNENHKKIDFYVKFLKKLNINLKFKEKNLANFKHVNYQFYTPEKLDMLLFQEGLSCSFDIIFWSTLHLENIKLYQWGKEIFKTEWRSLIYNDANIDGKYLLQHNNIISILSKKFILTQPSKEQYNIHAFKKESNWALKVIEQRVDLKDIVCFLPTCIIFKDDNQDYKLFLNNGLLIKLPTFAWEDLIDISTLLQNNYLNLSFKNGVKLGHIQNWELIFQEKVNNQQKNLKGWVFSSGKEIKPKLSLLKYDITTILAKVQFQEALKDNNIAKALIEFYKPKKDHNNVNNNKKINFQNKMRNNFYGVTGFLVKEDKWQLTLLDGIFMEITIYKNNNWFCKYYINEKGKCQIDLVNINNEWEIIEQYPLLKDIDLFDISLNLNPFVFAYKTKSYNLIHTLPNEQDSKTFLLKANVLEEIPTPFETTTIAIMKGRFFSWSKNHKKWKWNVFLPHSKQWTKTNIQSIYAPIDLWTDWRCKTVLTTSLCFSEPPSKNKIYYSELAELNVYEEADYSFMQEVLYIERKIRPLGVAKYKKSILSAKEKKQLSTQKSLWVLEFSSMNFQSPKCIRAYDIYKKNDCVLGVKNKHFFNLKGKTLHY